MDDISLRLDEKDDGTEVRAKNGDIIEICLASNPTTGYSWVPSFDTGLLEAVGERSFHASSDLIGAGGSERFLFRFTGPGSTLLTLEYRRPWEDAPPVKIVRFTIASA